MKLSKLYACAGLPCPDKDIEITGITNDSRATKPGYLFISVNGRNQMDYGSYLADAERNGAVAAVVQEYRNTDASIPQTVVEDVLKAYSRMSAEFFGNPANDLKLIGVTGTNGKTSSAYFTKAILDNVGYKVGLIGTVEILAGEMRLNSGLTTPEPFRLHGVLAEMKKLGMEYVVMECSSQALDQQRLYGIWFETAGFTNLTQDHIDYHLSFKNYLNAKSILFTQTNTAVLNIDDVNSTHFARIMGDRSILTYSVSDPSADVYASDIEYKQSSVEFNLCYADDQYPVIVSTPGRFAVANAICAISMAISSGVSAVDAANGMCKAAPVKGRAEICWHDDKLTIIIDYAHTPDAFMNILKAVDTHGKRKVVVFGCGGDRDATKRPLMATMAARYANFLVITSDNPRTEDPMHIIDDITLGLHMVDVPYVVVPDRREAIRYSIEKSEPGDTVFLLGKGHEDYQILSTGKIHFDEREIVHEIMQELHRK